MPGRQGWIARGGGGGARPGVLSFPLLLHGENATVSVGYVRSYEGFGKARFWLDGARPAPSPTRRPLPSGSTSARLRP